MTNIRARLAQLEKQLGGNKGDIAKVKGYVGECSPDSWGEPMPVEKQVALIERGRRQYLALTIDEGLEYGIERRPEPPPEEGDYPGSERSTRVEVLEDEPVNPFAGELKKESKPIPEEVDPLQVRIKERLLRG